MFEFEFGMVQLFYLYLCSFEESCLLVLWCAGGKCDMTCSDEDHGRSRDLVQRTGDGRIGRVLDGRMIERSGGIVCGLHRARGDEECGFLS
jgi:hypothetical protein